MMLHSILSIDLYGPADASINAALRSGLLVPMFDKGDGYYAANPITPQTLRAFASALLAGGDQKALPPSSVQAVDGDEGASR